MKNILLTLITILTLTTACKNTQNTTPSKMQMVIAVHDSLMPKMNTITKLIGTLNTKTDSTEMGMKYDAAKKDLQAAHQEMMDWMKGFGERFNHEEILNGKALTEEKKIWLTEEEQKVKKLKETINNSIENAEKILKETE